MNRTEVKDKTAWDKIVKARSILVVSQPFFGCLAMHLDLVEDNSCAAMWTDGGRMGYSPKFVHDHTDSEIQAVCAHEVMHCAYKHFTRLQHRNHVIFNWAGDYVINADLRKAGFKLPEPHLYDAKYDGMSSEEVYEKLLQEVKQQLRQQGKGQGGGSGSGKVIILPDTDLGLDVAQRDCCGEVRPTSAGNSEQQTKAERDWEANVRIAIGVAKRANAGTTPGYLDQLVKALKEPKVSWRELTRQFIDNSMSKDYSWSRPNRRMIHYGLYLPGWVSDSLNHMIFAVDTSGSCVPVIPSMGAEIISAFNDGIADKLTVIYTDTKVQHVDEYVLGDLAEVKIYGGGGTDFADVMQWVKQNAADAQCMVFLTDMLTCSFGDDPGMPVLWGCYLPEKVLASINPPFGTMIKVDTSE